LNSFTIDVPEIVFEAVFEEDQVDLMRVPGAKI